MKSVIDSYSSYSVQFRVEGEGSVYADTAFISVLDNLIRNALTHADTDQIDISIKEKDSFCEIKIADRGKGIPKNMKKMIFNPGFKYGTTGGTGLGVFIVKKTIERYGGEVKVKDNSPVGCVFILKLRNAK